MKFERTQIHYIDDVSTTVLVKILNLQKFGGGGGEGGGRGSLSPPAPPPATGLL